MGGRRDYEQLYSRLDSLCEGENDPVSLMATIACELYHAFEEFHWVGFYRNINDQLLKIGPYQGTHGCLEIPFSRGICGQCASDRQVQNVPDVSAVPHHIACSATTRSELVIPIVTASDVLIAVLDIDSDIESAFDEADEINLLRINRYFQDT